MKNCRYMANMNVMQITKRPTFYLSIFAVIATCFITVIPYFSEGKEGISVAYLIDLLISLSMAKKLIVLCTCFTCVMGFCTDWNSQYIKSIVIRSGIIKYTCSKVITCFVTSFFIAFIGLTVFAVILNLNYPVFLSVDIFPPYGLLATGKFPFLYPLAYIGIFSTASAVWTVVGLAVSAYIPNGFVAVVVPIASSYLLEELTRELPVFLNLYAITRGFDVLGQGGAITYLYCTFILLCIAVIAALIFHRQVKRRIRNEVI